LFIGNRIDLLFELAILERILVSRSCQFADDGTNPEADGEEGRGTDAQDEEHERQLRERDEARKSNCWHSNILRLESGDLDDNLSAC
jgi:hypothetical protein